MKTLLKTTLAALMLITISNCSKEEFNENITDFVTTWQTSADNQSVTIPTRANTYTYNYNIDWGDGTTQNAVQGNSSHVYEKAGTYTIRINGVFPAIFIASNNLSASQLRTVFQWGFIKWQTMEAAFGNVEDLTVEAIDTPDLRAVSSLKSMFERARVSGVEFNAWRVDTITTMENMFATAVFNENISDWDVSNVTSCSNFSLNATLDAINMPNFTNCTP